MESILERTGAVPGERLAVDVITHDGAGDERVRMEEVPDAADRFTCLKGAWKVALSAYQHDPGQGVQKRCRDVLSWEYGGYSIRIRMFVTGGG